MKLYEVAQLMATVQSFNNRTVGEADVVAWHSVLSDIPLADAEEAVRRHYAEHTEWLMPAHIRRIVRDIVRERESAANPWAPGQHGVRKEQAMPELPRGDRLTADDISPDVLDLLSQLRASLPDVPRERLFPRQAAWEREQRAFRRQDDPTPNPHYRTGAPEDDLPMPTVVRGGMRFGAPQPSVVEQARDLCRANGPHDSGMHINICPDEHRVPIAARCTVCGADSQDIEQHQQDYPNGSCE